MVAIPPQPTMTPEQAFARLQGWYQQKQALNDAKVSEVLERKTLGAFYFPEPAEGTNRLPLGGGFDLKLDHTITRKVDVAALDNVKASDVKKHKLNLDTLFPSKPSLSVTEYRKLSPAQRAFVDTLLDITESETPALAIVPQADTEGAAGHKAAAEAQAAPEVTYAHTIVMDATEAGLGDYFTDGNGNWWQLVEGGEDGSFWMEETDVNLFAVLEGQLAAMQAPVEAPAKPKRTRARKAT